MQHNGLSKLALLLLAPAFSMESKAELTDDALFELSLSELLNTKVSSTASLFSEAINEAPAPVTVITAKMIEQSGVKSIKDILLRYVPGMHYVQDSGEQVVAMRGVYASSQQKILFLLNGVRLNQRVLSAQDPDYSLSLNKLERIEVVRGPASSVYGNSALTGVINLITKSGSTYQGIQTTISSGSYGLQKVNIEYGQAIENGELYAWAQHFQTDGEKVTLAAADNWSVNSGESGHFYIDRFRDVPARDIGFQLKINNWTLLFSDGVAKYSKPFSSFGDFEGQTYDFNNYRKIDGIQPGGTKMYHQHLSLKYNANISNYDWSTNLYVDRAGVIGTGVSDPNDQSTDGYKVMKFAFDDQDIGIISYVGTEYTHNGYPGNVVIGAQFETVKANTGTITGFNDVNQSNNFFPESTMLLSGKEKQYAAFIQSKQRFSESITGNIGARYDKKYRRDNTHSIDNLSSRASLNYNLNDNWDIKGVYAESFVDAPYFYRYNTLGSYLGSEGLEPELLNSTQLSLMFTDNQHKLTSTTNVFYNNLNNFIFFNTEETDENAQKVFNSGEMITWGIENETTYRASTWSLSFNATYQKLVSHKNISVINGQIRDVPEYWFNVILNNEITENINTNFHVSHIGPQQSPLGAGAILNGVSVEDPNNVVDRKTIANFNLQYKRLFLKDLNASLNISNIFDTEHYQGGTVQHPYLQPGRWWSVTVSYLLD